MTISPLRLALSLLLIGLLAWVVVDHLRDQVASARQELATVQDELAGEREKARQTGEQLVARDGIDTQRTQELNRAQAENLRLQRDVADGRRRLLVKATCPVPGSAGAAGLADAGTAELTADARSDYFTLRSELIQTREMLLGLQDYIRLVVPSTPAYP